MQVEDRYHSMDNLRALAMLAGVVFHAALAYSPLMHRFWPPADAMAPVAVDAVVWFLHTFRMPLFFVVAGFFAALLVARRGLGGLLRNRCARVLLSLLVFLPPTLFAMHWLTAHAVAEVASPSPALAWLRAYIAEQGEMPFVPGWAHLWFLFYLMLFTVLVWVASALEWGWLGERIAALPPAAVPLAMPVPLAFALAGVGVPWPAPEFLVPSLWALVFFGLYFALGYLAFLGGAGFDRWRPGAWWLPIGALVAYAVLFWSTDGLSQARSTPLRHFAHALLEACAGLWMTLWCLIAAQRWLAGSRRALRWLADASYWVYLVHLPVLFAIQYRLLDVRMHWLAEFALATAATLALSFASYRWLVRPTIVGTLLNGRRSTS